MKAAGALVGSAFAHAALVAMGVLVGALGIGGKSATHEQVAIEVRERKRELPPPPPPPPPDEVKEQRRIDAPKPKAAEPEPPPAEPAKAAPVRVVGISLESTMEGGDGPAFAVGSTRAGETAERAAVPRVAAPGPSAAPPAVAAASPNQAATRIPVAGVKQTLPKRKRPRLPTYPSGLRSQGVEADVTVMVNLDETGKVTTVKIITPSSYAEFNEAARAAALVEEFEPAQRDGAAVPYTLSFTYRFRIEEG